MSKHYRPLSAMMPPNDAAQVWPVIRKPRPSHFMAAQWYRGERVFMVIVRAFRKRSKARQWSAK